MQYASHGRHCGGMVTGGHPMVRKYMKAERRRHKLTQDELAKEVGATRNTIIKLESGARVDEGIESAVETRWGWEIGSLDLIRSGGKPILANVSARLDQELRQIRDSVAKGTISPEFGARLEEKVRGDYEPSRKSDEEDTDGRFGGRHG